VHLLGVDDDHLIGLSFAIVTLNNLSEGSIAENAPDFEPICDVIAGFDDVMMVGDVKSIVRLSCRVWLNFLAGYLRK
jgi:hypothetical protein